MSSTVLPEQFAELSEFVPEWALEGEQSRFRKRIHADPAEIKRFYDVIMPSMERILQYLKNFPPLEQPEPERNLMWLALSCVEVSRIFEVWNQQDVRADFLDPERFVCVGYEGLNRSMERK
jgi:hypothetical protein